VKLYHAERGSDQVRSIASETAQGVWVSRLAVVELSSAIAIKVRTGFIGREDAHLILRQFNEDLTSSRLRVFAVGEVEFTVAALLIEKYAFDLRLRSLDAIQIAAAHGLKRLGLIGQFIAADRALCEVAQHEGFSVVNPDA
jgi:predicted nucleic acid-binding protein